MKLFGKMVLGAAAAAAVFAFASCTTTYPGYENTAFPADSSVYQVLGRVTVEFDQGKAAFYKLVEEAQKQYPEADDVVNITVDIKNKTKYIMSGVAIHYNK